MSMIAVSHQADASASISSGFFIVITENF